MLALKVGSLLKDILKECVLLLDEMSLNQSISYDISTKSFVGNITLPGHEGTATRALVFMLASITCQWKLTVACILLYWEFCKW